MSAVGIATTSGMAENADTARRWGAAGNTEWAAITKITGTAAKAATARWQEAMAAGTTQRGAISKITGMVAKATTRVTTFPVCPDARGITLANMTADMAAQAPLVVALIAAVPVVTTSVAALGGAGKSAAGGTAPRIWCLRGLV